MKWSLFNWKKPVVSSGEPEDYQVVKNTVSQNERNITNINNQITNVNNQLANTVSTNTAQTITGAKTFNEGITINKTPIPLLLKATNNNDKTYLVFRDSNNNSNLSIGARERDTSIEVNRGDLTIQTQQDNKAVAFETGTIKTNRARLEFGTEINAGYGGGTVKFIPEDNSTKTLQFFNNQPTDTRRFNIKINEPTEATNPATKNYVDTKETAINNRINTINTNITNINNSISELNEFKNSAQGLGLNLRYQDLTVGTVYGSTWGSEFYKYNFSISTLQETKFLAATIHFKGQANATALARGYQFTYGTTWGPEIWFSLVRLNDFPIAPLWSQTFIRIFYIDTLTSRTERPYFIVEEVNNEN